ncbi:MAG: deoxyribonuclease IV [Proteobacteria bacterium]|nr:deoxyribonuclease IV [Pseudomonadota bacterium]
MEGNKPLIGVHLSIGGGFKKLFSTAKRLKINVFQFFLSSPVVWKNIEITDEDAKLFNSFSDRFKFITAHSPYLVNLASSDTNLRKKSINRVLSDLKELEKLSVFNYVIHIGSNENLKEGTENVRNSLKDIFSCFPMARIILENSAGRKNDIGKNLDEIKKITIGFEENIGICIDSCHLFASGIDIRMKDELDRYYQSLTSYSLIDNVCLIHLNDSKYPAGSNKDRHWHIGKGEIGIKGFSNLLTHNFFSKLPLILETPKEDDMDPVNIETVKKIFAKRRVF